MKNQEPIQLYSSLIKSDIGDLFALVDDKHIYLLCFREEINKKMKAFSNYYNYMIESKKTKTHEYLQTQITEYFQGNRVQFDLPCVLWGTDFQKKVWKQLQTIPYGTTISYKTLANQIGNEKAYRAVGSANGKNNHVILIPCHRVIANDGTLGGYTGGLQIKERLLAIEYTE